MLEKLEDLPPGIEGVKAVGTVTADDYSQVLVPLIEAARRDHHRLRLVYEVGAELEGFSAGAMLADTRVTLRSMGVVEGCAIITDTRWIRAATRIFRGLMPYPVRVFAQRDRHLGIEWLSTLSQTSGVSHHLLTDSGVLVIEVNGPLRSRDFEALAITADAWIEMHGDLAGIVVHTRAVPRWADLSSLRSHVRFVQERHHSIARIAISTDSRVGRLAPPIARRLIAPKIAAFGYGELQAAIDWVAAGAPTRSRPGPILVDDVHEPEMAGSHREKPAGWPPS